MAILQFKLYYKNNTQMKSILFYTLLASISIMGCTSKIVFDAPIPVVITTTSDLLISEISTAINTDPNAASTRRHYVELYNGSAATIDLSNYAVGYFGR